MTHSLTRRSTLAAAALAVIAAAAAAGSATARSSDGVVSVKSAYSVPETVERLKKDIEAKGIRYFATIDQAELAKGAGIELKPSTLLLFGNPPLGIQFLTANPKSGLDWPVRLLVTQDGNGQVWASYTDFTWIAHRHGITNRDPQFKMATEVIQSITSAVTPK